MTAHTFDVHSKIKAIACGAARGVAAGAGDATAVTGVDINRKPQGAPGYDACTLVATYLTTLASTKTLSFAIEVQEADDDGAGAAGTYGTATALQAATVAETGADTAKVGQVRLEDTGFKSRKQWVRYNFTPDLNAAGTDIFDVALVAILGGPDVLPAT